MTILDRYLSKRLAIIGLFAILVFTICWLAPEVMLRAIEGVSHGQLTLDDAFAYLGYQTPGVLIYCLPIAMLFASVFLFRQLSLSGELTAILASGISFRRLIYPVAAVGLAGVLLFAFTQEVLVPSVAKPLREINERMNKDKTVLHTRQVTFVEKNSDGVMQKFVTISPDTKENQFIILFYEGKGDTMRISQILTADSGLWHGKGDYWELMEGVSYHVDAEGIYDEVKPFSKKNVHVSEIAHALLAFPVGSPSEFRAGQLNQYVRLLSRGGQTEDAQFYKVRFFQRFSLPLGLLLLTILGTAIGVERSRSRRNLGLTYAAALLLLYNILIPVMTTLGSIGMLPAVIAAILPLILTGLAGRFIIQLRQSEG